MFHALLIGIDRYVDPQVPDLWCAQTDAEALSAFLSDHLETDRQLTVLTNDRATKARIRRILTDELPRRMSADDVVLLYFAGYGAAELEPSTGDPSLHLVTHDTELARLYHTSIDVGAELVSWLKLLPAHNVAIVFDASFNGRGTGGLRGAARSLEGPGLRSGPRQRPERFSLAMFSFPDSCGVLTAAADHEVAAEDRAHGHGIFTQYMLEALEATTTGRLTSTLTSLRSDVISRMDAAGVTTQHPTLHGARRHGTFLRLRSRVSLRAAP
jgi:uncharacterized caspase-like protein